MTNLNTSRVCQAAGLALTLLVVSCSPTIMTPDPSEVAPAPTETTITSLATQPPADESSPTMQPLQPATLQASPTSIPAAAAAPTVVPTATQVPPVAIEHLVEPGDTLLGLAMTYNVPMAAIQLANDLGSETGLLSGQVLDIPPALEWPDASPFWVLMIIEAGHTLGQIAAEHDLTVSDLIATNHMLDGDVLQIGQALVLPLDIPAELARVPDPAPTLEPLPTAASQLAAADDLPAAEPIDTSTAEPVPAVTTAAAGWAGEVLQLINAARVQNGIAPYAYNTLLEQAALLHGQDCQQRGSCSHTGSDGSNVRTRVARIGYSAAGAAECIVYSSSPTEAVGWWLDEAPPNDAHRRTLLSTWVTEIGIAVVPNGSGSYYFIADFGRPN